MSSESRFFKGLTDKERAVVLKNTPSRLIANEDFFPLYELQSAGQLAQHYEHEENFGKAIDFFEMALRLYRENFPLKRVVDKQSIEILDELNENAKRLYYESMFELAKCYSLNDKPNHEKACKYLKKAADEYDDADAQNALGCMYLDGLGVAQDMVKATEYLEKSAVQGNMYAQTTLGRMLESGIGGKKDLNKALYWYKQAAEQGDDLATENLMRLQGADIHYMGSYEIPGTNVKAADIIDKIERKAEQGNFEAQCALAESYLMEGGFVLRDAKKGVELLTKYADEGNPLAQYNLGTFYNSGQFVNQNKKKAFQYFLRAAHQGLVSAKYNVGIAYYFGKVVERNVSKSFLWLLSAAEDEHPDAQFKIAMYYAKGIGCRYDADKIIYWLKRAADKGHYDAQVHLLSAYEELNLVPDISERELNRLRIIIQNNNPNNKGYIHPIIKLGSIPDIKNLFSDKSNKPSRDIRRFNDNLKKALQGNMYNMFVVGEYYQNGIGVEQDTEEAQKWFKKAADLGFRKAQEKLNSKIH